MDIQDKRCGRCEAEKSLDGFYKSKHQSGGYQHICKECTKTDRKERYAAKPEYANKQAKKWRAANPEKARQVTTKSLLKIEYGITEADYARIFQEQKGACRICERKLVSQIDYTRERSKADPLVGRVDHCHTTNKVRGILCHNCNVLIGLAGESTKVLSAATRYLQETGTE